MSNLSELSSTAQKLSSLSVFDLYDEPHYTPTSPKDYTEDDIDLSFQLDDLEPLFSDRNIRAGRNTKVHRAKNINDMNIQSKSATEELKLKNIKYDDVPKQSRKPRKKKRDEAEALFDFNAKPMTLKEFVSEVKMENFLPDIDPLKVDCLTIETNNNLVDPVIHEELAMCDLVAAKHNSNAYLDEAYGLNLKFNDDIEKQYLLSLNIDVEFDLSDTSVRYPIPDLYNPELFIQRRLFSCLEHLQFSDPKFLEKHLPVHVDLSRINHQNLVHDDDNSLQLLRNHFHQQFNSFTTLSKCYNNGNLDLKEIRKYFRCKKHRRFQNYLIIMFVLFSDPSKLKNRELKIKNLHEIYKESPFKNSDIKTCFNSVGIGFFDDYLSFDIVKRYIANLTKDRHNKRMKFFENKKKPRGPKKIRKDIEDAYENLLS